MRWNQGGEIIPRRMFNEGPEDIDESVLDNSATGTQLSLFNIWSMILMEKRYFHYEIEPKAVK